ncbi:MAG: DNA polymerase III subunit delta [SAR86 cluster bacterium]|uniref:DNA polymerase III subunit delta n=1 Tax=SAR86 cluster bacterium TaxID=2030880 RepID=A0A2A4MQ08_9GAMM|nr:MAG: DNA polymerase III subunit delta [SAR86 cluster bacterium]
MKLKVEQLAAQLNKSLSPLYWICGDETLLCQESADAIRSNCKSQGFSDRQIFTIEKGFNWENFSQATSNLSLFSEKTLFELRLNTAKLEDAGKKAVQRFLDGANPDSIVLITSPKLEASTFKTKWFKSFENVGVVVQIWPINAEQLPQWLKQRLQKNGINADHEAIKILAEKIEGNLLAAMQEIEKLRLLANPENKQTIQLNAKTVMQVVADNSRFNVYQLIDAALLGDAEKSLRILNALKLEGTMPLLLVGAISRELRSLLPMVERVTKGQSINGIMESHRVWFNRKQAVGRALARLKTAQIWQLLKQSKLIDQSVKGLSTANPWDELSSLVLMLCGTKTAIMSDSP